MKTRPYSSLPSVARLLPAAAEAQSNTAPLTFTGPTTTTIANPQTVADMRCTDHGVSVGAKVPSAGHGASGSADVKSASATLRLTRNDDGSLVVSGLGRKFGPARPPGLGGGHREFCLADAVAHEPCGGSPVQGYKG